MIYLPLISVVFILAAELLIAVLLLNIWNRTREERHQFQAAAKHSYIKLEQMLVQTQKELTKLVSTASEQTNQLLQEKIQASLANLDDSLQQAVTDQLTQHRNRVSGQLSQLDTEISQQLKISLEQIHQVVGSHTNRAAQALTDQMEDELAQLRLEQRQVISTEASELVKKIARQVLQEEANNIDHHQLVLNQLEKIWENQLTTKVETATGKTPATKQSSHHV